MNLTEALACLLTGSEETGHLPLGEAIEVIHDRAGTHKAAAAAAGVSPETWRRWRRGTQAPGRAKLPGLRAAAARARVRPDAARRFIAGDWRATGTVTVSSDTRRRRYMEIGPTLRTPALREVVRLAEAGDWHTARAELEDEIGGDKGSYVPGMHWEDEEDDARLYWPEDAD